MDKEEILRYYTFDKPIIYEYSTINYNLNKNLFKYTRFNRKAFVNSIFPNLVVVRK